MKDTAPDIIENFDMLTASAEGSWVWAVILIAAVIAAGGMVVFFLYRQKKLPFQEPDPIPPHLTALKELETLKSLLEAGDDRVFVAEVSRILRYYIEGRFSIRAPKLSTEEFLYLAEQDGALSAEQQAGLSHFLSRCDRVKFALGRLEKPECADLYEAAVAFVHQTREPDPAPDSEDAP